MKKNIEAEERAVELHKELHKIFEENDWPLFVRGLIPTFEGDDPDEIDGCRCIGTTILHGSEHAKEIIHWGTEGMAFLQFVPKWVDASKGSNKGALGALLGRLAGDLAGD